MSIEKVQEERHKSYGDFHDHALVVDNIMAQLASVNEKGPNPGYPPRFRTALFYLVSKLVRLATTPTHQDSALDLSSYADLWLKTVKKNEK